ncbi:MAG: hypothetical protein AAFY42_09995 [Pseudomonadota bacterium]
MLIPVAYAGIERMEVYGGVTRRPVFRGKDLSKLIVIVAIKAMLTPRLFQSFVARGRLRVYYRKAALKTVMTLK